MLEIKKIVTQNLKLDDLLKLREICFFVTSDDSQETYGIYNENQLESIFIIKRIDLSCQTELYFGTKISGRRKGYIKNGFPLLFQKLEEYTDIHEIYIKEFTPIIGKIALDAGFQKKDSYQYGKVNKVFDSTYEILLKLINTNASKQKIIDFCKENQKLLVKAEEWIQLHNAKINKEVEIVR